MAKVAQQKIIWHSEPVIDKEGSVVFKKNRGIETDEPDIVRIEIPVGEIVPRTVPIKVQNEWEHKGLVVEDPTKEMPDTIEGPPSMLLPVAGNPPVARRR